MIAIFEDMINSFVAFSYNGLKFVCKATHTLALAHWGKCSERLEVMWNRLYLLAR